MEDFKSLGLPEALLHTLDAIEFVKPTPIQAAAIPAGLAGRDVLGSAQTGTGKTAAFSIPLIVRLMQNREETALVMTPTRELATQVLDTMKKLIPPSAGIRTALLIGGASMFGQKNQLRQNPRLIVGTPGRINDHLQQRTVRLGATRFLVLDEMDRMMDMGFEVQIERIVKQMPKERQTLMFSATISPRIEKTAHGYMNNPQRISVGSNNTPIAKIKQELLRMEVAQKYNNLMGQLAERTGSVLVFVRTKRGADRMADKLSASGQSAVAIHGNLNQNQRNRVIAAFRAREHRILVATDVAARGLDIPHIEHVINYDLPQQPEDYIHRIGRTARNGSEGSAICFITPEDGDLWREIHKLLNPGAAREEYRGGANPAAPARKDRPKSHNRNGFEARRQRNGGGKKTSAFGGQGGGENFRPRQDRSESRGENRGNFRSENRSEGRSENRGGYRNENRPENRGGYRSENRSEGRGGERGNFRSGGRSENRSNDRGGFRSRDGGSKGGGKGPFGQRRNAA